MKLKWEREWRGVTADGDTWKVEVDTDCFDSREPFVVALFIENQEGDAPPDEGSLACLTPEQARDMAASLLREADLTDENNRRVAASTATEGKSDGD